MGNQNEKTAFETLPKYQLLKNQIEFFDQHSELKVPYHLVQEGVSGNTAVINGEKFINFASYNYLGLSAHPYVQQAAIEAIQKYGTSCSASRLALGSRPIHQELENAIAELHEVEAALTFTAGYMTNESTIGHLMTPKDLILYDEFDHRSILTGCVESNAKRLPFPHNDAEALDAILKRHRNDYERVLIVIEGVYSMDGDIPDLPQFIALKKRHSAWLMIDEAHSMGVIGATGRGISEYHHLKNKMDVDIWMGTLSKSFAACGGYIAGSHKLITYLKNTNPGYVFSAAMPPHVAAAALAAIQMHLKEPERAKRLQERSALFLDLCKAKGFDIGDSCDTPIIPFLTGSSIAAFHLFKRLYENRICAIPVVYPGVPDAAARVRFFITSQHTEEEIKTAVDILEREWNIISKKTDLVDFLTI